MSKNEYNFIERNALPKTTYIEDELFFKSQIKWAKTNQFNHLAKNHCGAIFVTNLILYYNSVGYDNLILNDIDDTFKEVHKKVGNGPKLLLAKDAKYYFSQRGYKLAYSSFRSIESIKKSIAEKNPVGILLSAGLFEWHWVMVVGWIQFESKETYLKIVTGWNELTFKYLKLGSAPYLWSATSYAINKI